MIQFSPNWLTDQRFLETVTILQNLTWQQGTFVWAGSKLTQRRLCLAPRRQPTVGRRVAGGKRGRLSSSMGEGPKPAKTCTARTVTLEAFSAVSSTWQVLLSAGHRPGPVISNPDKCLTREGYNTPIFHGQIERGTWKSTWLSPHTAVRWQSQDLNWCQASSKICARNH